MINYSKTYQNRFSKENLLFGIIIMISLGFLLLNTLGLPERIENQYLSEDPVVLFQTDSILNKDEIQNFIRPLSSDTTYTIESLMIDESGIEGNGTWVDITSQPWCTGSGTEIDPYVVADVTFDPKGLNYSLVIKDSYSIPFEIRDCVFVNGSASYADSGILVSGSTNGTFSDCEIYNNYNGIIIDADSENITLDSCVIYSNDNIGLVINSSYEIYAWNVSFYDNIAEAVYLLNYSSYIGFEQCDFIGDYAQVGLLIEDTDSSIIYNSTFESFLSGIEGYNADFISVIRNEIVDLDSYGWYFDSSCDDLEIIGNIIEFYNDESVDDSSSSFVAWNSFDGLLDSQIQFDSEGSGDYISFSEAYLDLAWITEIDFELGIYEVFGIDIEGNYPAAPLEIYDLNEEEVWFVECAFYGNLGLFGYGVYIENSSNLHFESCVFDSNEINIEISFCSDANIELYDCEFTNSNEEGISISNSTEINIDNCLVEFAGGTGVEISSSMDVNLSESVIDTGDYIGILVIYSEDVEIIDCEVFDNSYEGICLDNSTTILISDSNIVANLEEGLKIQNNCDDIWINSSTISDNDYEGIYIETSFEIAITECIIQSNGYSGLYMEWSSFVIIDETIVVGNLEEGLEMILMDNVILSNSFILLNDYEGILVDQSLTIEIDNCEITENLENGIEITESEDITIFQSNISENSEIGLYIHSSSILISIEESYIQNNLYEGLAIENSTEIVVFGNEISLNFGNILVQESDSITINNNLIDYSFDDNIQLISAYLIEISENSIEFSLGAGVYGTFLCEMLNISDNVIITAETGVYLELGVIDSIIEGNEVSDCIAGIILSDNVNDTQISFNDISGCLTGIVLEYLDEVSIIESNHIQEVMDGITLEQAHLQILIDNIITSDEICVNIQDSYYAYLEDNLMEGLGVRLLGYGIESHDILETNEVYGKTIWYYSGFSELTELDFENPGQIILVDCSDSQIEDLFMDEQVFAIQVFNCQSIEFRNLILIDAEYGISVVDSELIDLQENVLEDCFIGIGFDGYVNISSIISNTIVGSFSAILLTENAEDNVIVDNRIFDNNYGIYILGTVNLIYDNYIYENNLNAYDDLGMNYWNYTYFGNIWGDYLAIDVDGDHLGEFLYIIDGDGANTFDYLPQIYIPTITDEDTWVDFEAGTPSQIEFTVFDPNIRTAQYSLYMDGIPILANQDWPELAEDGYYHIFLDTSSLDAGIYLIEVELDDGLESIRTYAKTLEIINDSPELKITQDGLDISSAGWAGSTIASIYGSSSSLLILEIFDQNCMEGTLSIYSSDFVYIQAMDWNSTDATFELDLDYFNVGYHEIAIEIDDGWGSTQTFFLRFELHNDLPEIVVNLGNEVEIRDNNMEISFSVSDLASDSPVYSVILNGKYIYENFPLTSENQFEVFQNQLTAGNNVLMIIVDDGLGGKVITSYILVNPITNTTSFWIGIIAAAVVVTVSGYLVYRRKQNSWQVPADQRYLSEHDQNSGNLSRELFETQQLADMERRQLSDQIRAEKLKAKTLEKEQKNKEKALKNAQKQKEKELREAQKQKEKELREAERQKERELQEQKQKEQEEREKQEIINKPNFTPSPNKIVQKEKLDDFEAFLSRKVEVDDGKARLISHDKPESVVRLEKTEDEDSFPKDVRKLR